MFSLFEEVFLVTKVAGENIVEGVQNVDLEGISKAVGIGIVGHVLYNAAINNYVCSQDPELYGLEEYMEQHFPSEAFDYSTKDLEIYSNNFIKDFRNKVVRDSAFNSFKVVKCTPWFNNMICFSTLLSKTSTGYFVPFIVLPYCAYFIDVCAVRYFFDQSKWYYSRKKIREIYLSEATEIMCEQMNHIDSGLGLSDDEKALEERFSNMSLEEDVEYALTEEEVEFARTLLTRRIVEPVKSFSLFLDNKYKEHNKEGERIFLWNMIRTMYERTGFTGSLFFLQSGYLMYLSYKMYKAS